MANEIAWLRSKLDRRNATIESQATRIRELELKIADLDYELRG